MKLPLWFRIGWWIIITALAAVLFFFRFPAISQGQSAPMDALIFFVLIALLLVPIFQEVSFFGLKFKQAVEELKKDMSMQFAHLKTEIQTTITNNINVITPRPPPPDEQLPEIGRITRTAITEALRGEEVATTQSAKEDMFQVDSDTKLLFAIRHGIESKLRHIAFSSGELAQRVPIHKLSGSLVKEGLLHPKIADAIREVYSVCSPAIHGESPTKAQVDFVRDVGPQVIGALSEIERRTTGST
ncbi:MAG: hypothetical protein JW759_05935 [Candidatus Coatesbacteria bacterium]|nr:hypothetical protein [Candidatus Coatesbacteria bacterium]